MMIFQIEKGYHIVEVASSKDCTLPLRAIHHACGNLCSIDKTICDSHASEIPPPVASEFEASMAGNSCTSCCHERGCSFELMPTDLEHSTVSSEHPEAGCSVFQSSVAVTVEA